MNQTLLVTLLFYSLVIGCKKNIDPYQIPILEQDREQTEFPPDDDEIGYDRKFTLPVIIDKAELLTSEQRIQFENLVSGLFERKVNSTVFDTKKVLIEHNLSYLALINQPNNFLAIHAHKLKANFAYLIFIQNKKTSGTELQIDFELNYFDVNASNYLLKKKLSLDLNDQNEFEKVFGEYLQIHLPQQAFIIEMRGGKKVARISIGKNAQLSRGREVILRKRTVHTQIFGEGTETIFKQKNIRYKKNPRAYGKVFAIEDETAWISLDDADAFFLGDPVFLIPE